MAKQHPRSFSFSQWLYIVVPALVGVVGTVFEWKEMPFPEPLYIGGGGLALSLLIGFVMIYGEDL